MLLPAHPSVNDVQIIGEVVEGGTIKGVGKYFGGREGPSKFEWLREDSNSGLVFYYQVVIFLNVVLTILWILLFKDTSLDQVFSIRMLF